MARRTTDWSFADATERDTYLAVAGVLDGDTCTLVSDRSTYYFDGAAWKPLGTLGQASLTAGSGAATVPIDWNVSRQVRIDTNAATSVTFTMANPVAGATYTLLAYNGPGVGIPFTYPGNVLFPGGGAPILDPTGIVRLYYDGTNYYAVSDVNLL